MQQIPSWDPTNVRHNWIIFSHHRTWCSRFVYPCSKYKIRNPHCIEHLIAWSFEFMALCSLVGSYHVWGTAASAYRVATFQTSIITQKKSSPLTMEAAVSSKTMVITCCTTYCNIPEVYYPENQGSRFLQHVGSHTVSHVLICVKDTGNNFLRNTGNQIPNYMV